MLIKLPPNIFSIDICSIDYLIIIKAISHRPYINLSNVISLEIPKSKDMQQNSYGFNIEINSGMDLTNTVELGVIIRKPNGIYVKRSITVANNTNEEGNILFEIQEGDFDQSGEYFLQLIDSTGGKKLKSRIAKFPVYPSL